MKKIKWGELPENDFSHEYEMGDSHRLFLFRKEDCVGISYHPKEEEPVYSHFYISVGGRLSLIPALPDKPVVIKPLDEISILPGIDYSCVVPVPFLVQIKYGSGKKALLLKEFPVAELSRSWFGDSASGELSYFHPGVLKKSASDYDEQNSFIFCPVTISNKSNQILFLERMNIRVPYLSLYSDDNILFSQKSFISFKGQDQISQLTLGKGSPYPGKHLKFLANPRLVDDNGLLNRSFYFIKSIYNG